MFCILPLARSAANMHRLWFVQPISQILMLRRRLPQNTNLCSCKGTILGPIMAKVEETHPTTQVRVNIDSAHLFGTR